MPHSLGNEKNKQTNEQKNKDLRPQKRTKPPEFWRYEVAGSGKMGGPDPVFLLLFY